MTVTREATMPVENTKPHNLPAMIVWPIIIVLTAAGVLGGFAGYNQAMVDDGGTPLPAWAGPLAALGFGAVALAVYARRYRSAWQSLPPRRRQRALRWVRHSHPARGSTGPCAGRRESYESESVVAPR